MFFHDGYFKPLVVRKVGAVMTARQLVPALFVCSLLVAAILAPWSGAVRAVLALEVGVYGAANLVVAAATTRRAGPRVGLIATVVFPIIHFGYGLGYLLGVFDFLIRGRRGASAVSLSR
jgi:hypothetical protein